MNWVCNKINAPCRNGAFIFFRKCKGNHKIEMGTDVLLMIDFIKNIEF